MRQHCHLWGRIHQSKQYANFAGVSLARCREIRHYQHCRGYTLAHGKLTSRFGRASSYIQEPLWILVSRSSNSQSPLPQFHLTTCLTNAPHPLLLLKGMAVRFPGNLESEWYVRHGGIWGIVCVAWDERNGRNGMAEMEAGGLGMLSM